MRNPYLNLLSTSWKYSNQNKIKYLLIYFSYAFIAIIDGIKPIIYGFYISNIEKATEGVFLTTIKYISVYISIILLEWSIKGTMRVQENKLAFKISKNFSLDLLSNIYVLPLEWHNENHSGAIINKVRKSTNSLNDFFKNGYNYFLTFAKLIIAIASIVYFSPIFGFIAISIGTITLFLMLKIDVRLVDYLKKYNLKEDRINASTVEVITNIKTVKALNLSQPLSKWIINKIDASFPVFVKYAKTNEWKWFIANISVALIYCLTIVGYIYNNYKPGEVIAIGPLVTLVLYVNQFTVEFNGIAWLYNQIVQLNTNVTSVNQILTPSKKYSLHLPEKTTDKNKIEWNSIQISNLNFSYASRDQKLTLKNISVNIRKGSKLALIGKTGSGKTTLLYLLSGLHSPLPAYDCFFDNFLDKKDIGLINQFSNLVTQDAEIFEDTLLFNIALGTSYPIEEIIKACEVANFMEVVYSLPHGFNTIISEKGNNFSGGQRQRLALARGILSASGKEIILMDEPTSNIDPKLSKKILHDIFEHFKYKTLIITIHNYDLLYLFDYIYAMDQGEIIAEGEYHEISATSYN